MKKIKNIFSENIFKNKEHVFSIFSYKDQSMNNYIRSIINSEDNTYINNMFKQQRIKACKIKIH